MLFGFLFFNLHLLDDLVVSFTAVFKAMIDAAYRCGAETCGRGYLGVHYAFAEHFCCLEPTGHCKDLGGGTNILKKAFTFGGGFKGRYALIEKFNVFIKISIHLKSAFQVNLDASFHFILVFAEGNYTISYNSTTLSCESKGVY